MKSRLLCVLSLLWLPIVVHAQAGSTYYDLSLDSDGVTVDGVEVMDSSMTGPHNCDHNYEMGFYFENTSYVPIGTNDQTIRQTDPASQYESFRIDDSMVGSSGTTYYVGTSASAFCECVSQQFVSAGGTSLFSLHTTYYKTPIIQQSTPLGETCGYAALACTSGTPTCQSQGNVYGWSFSGSCPAIVKVGYLVFNNTCIVGLAFDATKQTQRICN
jgi:hypothetical protein